ncbi:MAG: hypothetical protein V4649_19125 [Bacteroidota bacterium]
MKKVMMGLLLGAAVTAAGGFAMLPKVKQAEYERGMAQGRQEGVAAGTAAGMAQGEARVHAQYKEEKQSAETALQARRNEQRRAAKPYKPAPKPIQNWHVIGNQIAEPIMEPAI